MAAHRGNQNLFRNHQKLLGNRSDNRAGVLDQVGDFVEEPLVRQQVPTGGFGKAVGFAPDGFTPTVLINQNKMALALFEIVGRVPHRETGVGHETVSP